MKRSVFIYELTRLLLTVSVHPRVLSAVLSANRTHPQICILGSERSRVGVQLHICTAVHRVYLQQIKLEITAGF